MKPFILSAAFGIACSATVAHSATFTNSFAGDVCSIPPAITEAGEAQCSFIEQAGSARGVFELEIGGVNPNIVGDALITITARADLFQSDQQIIDRGGSRNNLDEYFGLSMDDFFLGLLFEGNGADEGAISAGLASSVIASIAAAGDNSVADILLSFTLPESIIKPRLSDGSISAVFDFSFGLSDPSHNVNFFGNPSFTIKYDVGVSPIPVPASLPLLAVGLGGLAFMARRKRKSA